MDHDFPRIDRRGFLGISLGGALGFALGGQTAWADEKTALSVIVLNMAGGMSQTDTFDPKSGHKNAGPLKAIKTQAAAIQLSELLPKLAEQADHLSLIRSMATREGAHDRARRLIHTGYAPSGTVRHPDLGSLVAQATHDPTQELPNYVHVAGTAVGAGFLGVDFQPFAVADPTKPVANLGYPKGVDARRFGRRRRLLEAIERRFRKNHPGGETEALTKVYQRADRLMHSPKVAAFDLSKETMATRASYGENRFGQGCLMARRLVEAGARAVEVELGGWDTHDDNFTKNTALAAYLDAGFGGLLADLAQRDLLRKTVVILTSEFGRTPRINANDGRDHFANGWTVALAGGPIRGGRVVGETSGDGMKVTKRPIGASDLMATLFHALGLDPDHTNYTREGRPLRAVDKSGKVIRELFAS
ncbi:MAG: DUF1501 domain-containing protein [Planctomycetes bacterium]|nr:DUF1501 domain-containing protein [Planctomycetota bacterium]